MTIYDIKTKICIYKCSSIASKCISQLILSVNLGYGDSDVVDLSEEGVVMDSKYVFEWVMKKVNGSAPVFVWGHSLGTG